MPALWRDREAGMRRAIAMLLCLACVFIATTKLQECIFLAAMLICFSMPDGPLLRI